MSRIRLERPGYKYCSSCKGHFFEDAFFRKGKTWKTCNACSAGRTKKRHDETLHGMTGFDDLQGQIAGLQITPQEYSELLMQQKLFHEQQQQQFEQYWQQQHSNHPTLQSLLTHPTVNVQSPIERFIQQHQLNRRAQQVVSRVNALPLSQQTLCYSQALPEPHPELRSAYPHYPSQDADRSFSQGIDQNMLLDHGMQDVVSHYDVQTATYGTQSSYSWINPTPALQHPQLSSEEFDFEADLAALLRASIDQPAFEDIDFDADFEALLHTGEEPVNGSTMDQSAFDDDSWSETSCVQRADSKMQCQQNQLAFASAYHNDDSDMMDVSMEGTAYSQIAPLAAAHPAQQTPHPHNISAPVKRVREPPFTLEAFFTDFNPSDDVLRQPLPQHNLTGELLVKHHIRELGLAIRLSLLPGRWYRMSHNDWFRAVEFLDHLEETEQITAWGPLSDWLVTYQNGMEDILEAYPPEIEVDYQTAYKVRGARAALFNSLRKGLKVELQQLFTFHKQELSKLFVELTGQTEHKVNVALKKQVCLMKNAIVQDCEVNDILNLPPFNMN